LRKTKYNKATEHHIGSLLGKLSKLRKKIASKTSSKKGIGYSLKKQGHATAILVGFPSVGKSTLLNVLTSAKSKVAEYDFTTLNAVPGIMEYRHARIQLVDLPGIITGAAEGRGGGRQILSVMRNADLIIIMLDSKKPEKLKTIKKELYSAGIRLDSKKPNVRIIKKMKGGIRISSVKKQDLSNEFMKLLLRKSGIINAEIIIQDTVTKNQLIDVLVGNCFYVPSLVVFNKIDELTGKELSVLREKYPGSVFISAEKNYGTRELKQKIFEKVKLMRVFLKPQHGKSGNEPLILKQESTVRDLCLKIHKIFLQDFKYAMVWGESAKFPSQKVGLSHVLKNDDVVTIIT